MCDVEVKIGSELTDEEQLAALLRSARRLAKLLQISGKGSYIVASEIVLLDYFANCVCGEKAIEAARVDFKNRMAENRSKKS